MVIDQVIKLIAAHLPERTGFTAGARVPSDPALAPPQITWKGSEHKS